MLALGAVALVGAVAADLVGAPAGALMLALGAFSRIFLIFVMSGIFCFHFERNLFQKISSSYM